MITKKDNISSLVNIEISKSSLLNNLNEFRKIASEKGLAPVLKSNAYGHGLNIIGNLLDKESVEFFVIDSYFEAKKLRNDDIKTPLLIIGYTNTDSIIKNNLKNISFTIANLDTLREIAEKINKKTYIHLKFDTGMHRQGILYEDIDLAINLIKNNNKIILDGICSHLADADGETIDETEKQIEIWNSIVNKIKKELPNARYFHLSNTAGHNFIKKIQSNISRLGIGLYGISNIENLNLKPVLKIKTIITGIKNIKSGEKVGYNFTFEAKNNTKIATIPVGYFEAIDRRLSNKGFVKIDNKFCPIIGRVSMNITTIDISNTENIKLDDEVCVISNIKSDINSVENIAKTCNTIPYEILIHIPEHLKRVVVD